ncbi:MAG: methyltransferase domain-containing protein [Ktedonobacteraceae bacterium]|nr:methyltransferase domain-containing protein [Ktedonobacteraceae bacterium]
MTYINNIASAGEWARLDHQARLVSSVTRLLPPLLEDEELTAILDVGCGPGRWALDMAADRPEAKVTGIDLSREMMEYANARARTQHLKNVSFRVQDFLANKLPFPEQSFDLIHVRFAVGWLKHAGWLLLLSRCFVLLKPGGYLVITEGEGIYTNSAALERLHELLCAALHASGYGLSSSPRFMGVVAQLGYLLAQTGFQHIGTDASVLDYSYAHEEANRAWLESFHALISESSLFLIQSGVTKVEELAQVDAQLSIDMYQEDFCGIGPLFTFSAQKPAGAEKE